MPGSLSRRVVAAWLALPAVCLFEPATPVAGAEARALALTFDDPPFAPRVPERTRAREQTRQLLAPGELPARVALLEAWPDAGMDLGNHGFGHLDGARTSAPRCAASPTRRAGCSSCGARGRPRPADCRPLTHQRR